MRAILSTLRHDHSAATAIEYALVAFLVSVAGFVTYSNIGGGITGFFQNVADFVLNPASQTPAISGQRAALAGT